MVRTSLFTWSVYRIDVYTRNIRETLQSERGDSFVVPNTPTFYIRTMYIRTLLDIASRILLARSRNNDEIIREVSIFIISMKMGIFRRSFSLF